MTAVVAPALAERLAVEGDVPAPLFELPPPAVICGWCGWLDDPARGDHCSCRAPVWPLPHRVQARPARRGRR